MAERKEPTYRLDRTSQVVEQIRALGIKAGTSGIHADFVVALKQITNQLKTRPLEWGDPEWRTQRKEGKVFHGIQPPLIVPYVVFEPERIVCILKMKPLPGSPLA